MSRSPLSLTMVRAALVASGGNVARAAEDLGIARKNLYIRLAALGVHPDEYRSLTPAAAPTGEPATKAATPRHARLRVARTFYLRPEQMRALDDASLSAVLRVRLSPSEVMQRFMDDGGFAEWLARAGVGPKNAGDQRTGWDGIKTA